MQWPKIVMNLNHTSDSVFISWLTEITEANLANEHFGVNELEGKTGLSHSQLHHRLKAITNQSISQFIRELRLKKAKELLEKEIYTISEIAFNVGFSSPSYFNKCFHDYFGCSPGEFKKQNYKNTTVSKNEVNTQMENNSESARTTKQLLLKKRIHFINVLIFIFGGLAIAVLSFYTYKYFLEVSGKSKTKNLYKSIAVLPLTDNSVEEDNQDIANGIMEDILNRLSQIETLDVKSRISADNFNQAGLTMPEIAKELNVTYILEGSILKENCNIKIYVRLYDAINETSVWTGKYYDEVSDIIYFVSNVSKQVASELETVLSQNEIKQFKKKYIEHEEAYRLYHEGRFYWQLRGEENIRKSIEYYHQAVAIDSNYSLPYVGLADAYTLLSYCRFYPWEEGICKGKKYISKALSIENNLAEAYASLGFMATYFECNWNLAEKEFKRALEINPNYATAHQWYAEYLDIIGRKDEARKHINLALELQPYTEVMQLQSYYCWMKERNYNNALAVSDKIFEINQDSEAHSIRNFNIYIREKNGEMALSELKRSMGNTSQAAQFATADSIYSVSGLEGIIFSRIKLLSENGIKNYYHLAKFYAVAGETETALEYLSIAYTKKATDLIRIKYDPDFIALRSESRFIDLLKKMNLGGY